MLPINPLAQEIGGVGDMSSDIADVAQSTDTTARMIDQRHMDFDFTVLS